MAVHLGATDKKSSQTEDRVGTAALENMDEVTRKLEHTPAGDASSHGTKYVTKDVGQQGVEGHIVNNIPLK